MLHGRRRNPTALVVVLGEEPIPGRALELLLQYAGYEVQSVQELGLEEETLIREACLLLFMPGARERHGTGPLSQSQGAPVLELVRLPEYAASGFGSSVPWPCRAEELERRIESVLESTAGLQK